MMSRQISRADLLRPSLAQDKLAQAPYSTQAGFVTAFLGGPVAALMMAALNAHRLQRLPRDLSWIVAALMGVVGFEYGLTTSEGRNAMTLLQDWIGMKPQHTLTTMLGLLAFGLGSLAHGKQQRAATLIGLDRPKGLWVGLGIIVTGSLVHGLFRLVLR